MPRRFHVRLPEEPELDRLQISDVEDLLWHYWRRTGMQVDPGRMRSRLPALVGDQVCLHVGDVGESVRRCERVNDDRADAVSIVHVRFVDRSDCC